MSEAQQAGHSDWEDQDLLTVDLASERLEEEIAALERLIVERSEESGDKLDISDTRARLERLIEARARLRQRHRAGS